MVENISSMGRFAPLPVCCQPGFAGTSQGMAHATALVSLRFHQPTEPALLAACTTIRHLLLWVTVGVAQERAPA